MIGAGGRSTPIIQYLTAAGIGTIGLIDDDVVELSNLQRQVMHSTSRLGMKKVFLKILMTQNLLNIRLFQQQLMMHTK